MDKKTSKKIKAVGDAARLAAVLEASAEKPGNVTPTHEFDDSSYPDFLAGAIAIGSSIEEAALRGYAAGRKEIYTAEIGVGKLILAGVSDVAESHKGGNTHLGTLMLMVPIAAATGMCMAQKTGFKRLRENLGVVLSNSTKEDAKNLYKAIRKARAGGLGSLVVKDASFIQLMRISSKKDRIAKELSDGMTMIFEIGLPAFEENCKKTGDIRKATLETYMLLLSRFPDTLIAKKCGAEKSKEVSDKAKAVLEGTVPLEELDKYLRARRNSLNPGTTADLVSAILLLWVIKNKKFFSPPMPYNPRKR